jgi:hypothetical protein
MDTLPIKPVHKSSSIRRFPNNLQQAARAPCLLGNPLELPGRRGKPPLRLKRGQKGRVDFHGNGVKRLP